MSVASAAVVRLHYPDTSFTNTSFVYDPVLIPDRRPVVLGHAIAGNALVSGDGLLVGREVPEGTSLWESFCIRGVPLPAQVWTRMWMGRNPGRSLLDAVCSVPPLLRRLGVAGNDELAIGLSSAPDLVDPCATLWQDLLDEQDINGSLFHLFNYIGRCVMHDRMMREG